MHNPPTHQSVDSGRKFACMVTNGSQDALHTVRWTYVYVGQSSDYEFYRYTKFGTEGISKAAKAYTQISRQHLESKRFHVIIAFTWDMESKKPFTRRSINSIANIRIVFQLTQWSALSSSYNTRMGRSHPCLLSPQFLQQRVKVTNVLVLIKRDIAFVKTLDILSAINLQM